MTALGIPNQAPNPSIQSEGLVHALQQLKAHAEQSNPNKLKPVCFIFGASDSKETTNQIAEYLRIGGAEVLMDGSAPSGLDRAANQKRILLTDWDVAIVVGSPELLHEHQQRGVTKKPNPLVRFREKFFQGLEKFANKGGKLCPVLAPGSTGTTLPSFCHDPKRTRDLSFGGVAAVMLPVLADVHNIDQRSIAYKQANKIRFESDFHGDKGEKRPYLTIVPEYGFVPDRTVSADSCSGRWEKASMAISYGDIRDKYRNPEDASVMPGNEPSQDFRFKM